MAYIQQLYTNCLAQAAYYIESDGEAAVVDPIRDTQAYIDLANSRGAKIKYILETHFHADFVSGHLDLAKETGATIVYGPQTQTQFPVHVATDGEMLALGKSFIKVLHTPGHTLESSCFLLVNEEGKEDAIFTGDTLFVGDVGRPDLLDGIMTKEALAGMMYDSLRTKIIPLADDITHYPGHGPGSACGKNIGKETHSTIGTQKQLNYALQPMEKQAFIDILTTGISPAPKYFFEDAKLNKSGYDSLDLILQKGLTPLSVDEVDAKQKQGITILDSRIPDQFQEGFIPGSISVGLNGDYAIWAASLLDIHKPLIIVCEPGKEEESVVRLTRVGFSQIAGYLKGGFDSWKDAGKPIDMVISVSAYEFALDYKFESLEVVDVRKPGEFEQGHVKNARHLPLADFSSSSSSLPMDTPLYIHCAGGYRSMVAASILKAKGYKNIKNVLGGFGKIKLEEIELEIPATTPA